VQALLSCCSEGSPTIDPQKDQYPMRLRSGVSALLAIGTLAGCEALQPTLPDAGGASLATLGNPVSDPTPSTIGLRRIGGFAHGGPGASEITAYDAVSKRLFVVNGSLGTVDVLDLKDPTAPTLVGVIQVGSLGAAANSVAARGGIVAVAIEANTRTDPGTVAFYRGPTLQLVSAVTVGALPDMLTFTPDGRQVLVANEGEPNADYTVDPEGSVSIIDVTNINRPTVRTAGFGAFNGQRQQLIDAGVRIFGKNNPTVAQDLEPEYVTVSDDGRTAWVALQENNAFAEIDIASATVTKILPFGYKDHSVAGNGLDASDRDGPSNGPAVNIRTWPVFGMYQPDGMASYTVGGQTFLVTANEGDARDYGAAFNEESRVNALTLNPTIFSDAVCGGTCKGNSRLGRLTVTTTMGFNPVTEQYDALYAFGARSVTIWTTNAQRVWDSGDDFEQRTKTLSYFNANHGDDAPDTRSDNKGPEPEDVVLGRLGAKTFAFIGLERLGGVMVYDVTNPYSPAFVTYATSRVTHGDRGPEGLHFVPAKDSPNKRPLLIVGHEVSGTTAIYEIELY